MPLIKRILCLANSRKLSGRCVAGRLVRGSGPGPWIRPVSDRPSEEVSAVERQYQDGTDPQVLDIVDVPLSRHRPHACQSENWLLDPRYSWSRVGQIGWAELQRYVENPKSLWMNGRSTYHGSNDEILQSDADELPNSLYLVRVSRMNLRVFVPGAGFGNSKRRVQAEFRYNGDQYALRVTDPLIEREYGGRPYGRYQLGECCLCVSLGEEFRKQDGQCCRYKLVASVIERARVSP
jgi:hypothetical protein